MRRVLRQKKDGGLSLCSVSDDRVGIGRCVHTLSFSTTNTIKEGENVVEVGNIKASEKEVKETIKMFSKLLTKKEKKTLLKHLRK